MVTVPVPYLADMAIHFTLTLIKYLCVFYLIKDFLKSMNWDVDDFRC